ncbi:ferredoxin--NADP+ reductase [Kineococcus xinjiangensis]|uniref:ferredoxin--NADP(+) reductase n=1 Tax=Kineococcus xinjiangensis TaxID=512762 RepID=A0A2S6IE20_9ACTN|nr:FAD-dependent oxidoreductase [Kineococcus xinjiangensis]PPK92410.1 ferredoxin--NADP+ reductase [Kineococcus xinjiangensis]
MPDPLPRPLRVAVVGAGPSGAYLVDALTRHAAEAGVDVLVDVVERLPTPFGLLRYGVAPDHPKIRSLRLVLERALSEPRVRLWADVEVGSHVTAEELLAQSDAVVWALGASADRPLGIPGEDLPGCVSAVEVVGWYCGVPDAGARVAELLRRSREVVVVGAGNVALDVVRILAKGPHALDATDMPLRVLEALDASRVRRVTLLGRRGPAQATFTTKELRELGAIPGAQVVVEDARAALDLPGPAPTRTAERNLAVLREWAARPSDPAVEREVRLRFLTRPLRIVGDGDVTGLEVERNALGADGSISGTGETEVLPAQMVVRAAGSRVTGVPGLPVNEAGTAVPNVGGRVVRDGRAQPGEYVTGWLAHGPVGVIGDAKADANRTAATVLADAAGLLARPAPSGPTLDEVLRGRGRAPLSMADWARIDAAETALGRAHGRERTTLDTREDILAALRGEI